MVRRFALMLAAAVLSASSAYAQDQASAPDIVVVGERVEQMSRDFAASIAATTTRADQLARWDESVCIGATGLAEGAARGVVEHISARAAQVGLRTGAPGCTANVMVIFTDDSDRVARTVVDQRRDLLGYYTSDAVSTGGGREGLEAFASTRRPVRWWQVARNVGSDGRVLDDPRTTSNAGQESAAANQAAAAGQAPTGIGSYDGVQSVRSSGSRLRRDTRQDLNYILIIVDAQRIADFPSDAVLDYVSMVALAQIDPNAAPSAAPSILSLFTSPVDATPAGMTQWDEAYLQGLYRASRDATNTQAQVRDIARTMASRLGDGGQ